MAGSARLGCSQPSFGFGCGPDLTPPGHGRPCIPDHTFLADRAAAHSELELYKWIYACDENKFSTELVQQLACVPEDGSLEQIVSKANEDAYSHAMAPYRIEFLQLYFAKLKHTSASVGFEDL